MVDDSRSGPCGRWVREPASLFPNDDISFCLVLFPFSMAGAEATINSTFLFSLSPLTISSPLCLLPSYVCVCAFSFQSSLLYWTLFSHSVVSCLACLHLTPSCLFLLGIPSFHHPWLSAAHITNGNGLCSLMWEFCNQPLCMTHALMALIFSDFNAPQHQQQQEDSTPISTANGRRVINPVSESVLHWCAGNSINIGK